MVGDSKSEPPSADKRKFSKRVAALAEYSRSKIQSGAVDLTARVKDFNAKSAIDAVLDAPDRFKKSIIAMLLHILSGMGSNRILEKKSS